MKKLCALLMAVWMTLSIASCGAPAANSGSQPPVDANTPPAQSDAPLENSAFAGGTGTETDPYQIETRAQLEAFRDSVNDGSQGGYAGAYIELTADLDMTGIEWTPIGTMEDKHMR